MNHNGLDSTGNLNIMFFQFRYHTNNHPIVKTLIEEGNDVEFLSQTEQPIENYSIIEPTVMDFFFLFRPILFLYSLLYKFDVVEKTPDAFLRVFGVVSPFQLTKIIRGFHPDVLIIKNYYPSTFVVLVIAKILGINTIFLDQDSVSVNDNELPQLKRLAKSVIRFVENRAPNSAFVRMTPVKSDYSADEISDSAYYVPFVIEKKEHNRPSPERDTNIKIISVGKFRSSRKNHLLLLKVFNSIRKKYDVSLTLVGELNDPTVENYKRIQSYIEENNLTEVSVQTNINHCQMDEIYNKHDLFVLPSSNEPASVALLEAMAHGLPVICSDTNGTKCYIKCNVNGYIFNSGDRDDLESKVTNILSEKEKVPTMGEESRKLVRENHHPTIFETTLREILEEGQSDEQT